MKAVREKYRRNYRHIVYGLAALFFLHGYLVNAQERADSIGGLKYQLDTISVFDTIPIESTAPETEPGDDEETGKEYFLRKEFTGGLRDTFQFRQVPAGVVRNFKADKDFWYADASFKKNRQAKTGDGFDGNPLLQGILWLVIIGGFLTFLFIYLRNSNIGLFRKSQNVDLEAENGEDTDIFSIDYQAEIANAIASENFRLATRLMFLHLLRTMSDAGVIQYRQDSTNLDYMMQLHGTLFYHDFSRLARHYEYSWYGRFGLDREKFNLVKKAFDNFQHRLKR